MNKIEETLLRRSIRRIIKEAEGDETEPDLSEEDPASARSALPPTKKEKGGSVDDQIDRLLDQYETEHSEDTDLDLESYAQDVYNLLSNYDNLLEFKSTITKRAAQRLAQHHDDTMSDQFLDIMSENFGVVPGKADGELSDEIVPPVGQGGGPDVGGGMGGAPAA